MKKVITVIEYVGLSIEHQLPSVNYYEKTGLYGLDVCCMFGPTSVVVIFFLT